MQLVRGGVEVFGGFFGGGLVLLEVGDGDVGGVEAEGAE